MSYRGFQTRPVRPSALYRNQRPQTQRVTVHGRFRRPIFVVVTTRGFGRIAVGIVILFRSHAAVRSIKHSSPRFLPCLSGHTLRVKSGARRHLVLCFMPFGFRFLPVGALRKSRPAALGSRASRSGFANG
jgi:hypothetical protein